MRSLVGFSTASQISLEVDGDDYTCRKCRLGDSCTDIPLGDDANGVEAHLHKHEAAGHWGVPLALERLLAHFVGGGRG